MKPTRRAFFLTLSLTCALAALTARTFTRAASDRTPDACATAQGAAGIADAFQRIGLDLHNLYTLGFKSAAADGKWHKLKVKVQPPPKWPRLEARTREGFYAPTSSASK